MFAIFCGRRTQVPAQLRGPERPPLGGRRTWTWPPSPPPPWPL